MKQGFAYAVPPALPDTRLVASQPIGVRQGSVCAHIETEWGERGGERQRASKRERERRREGEWCNERESGGERGFKEAARVSLSNAYRLALSSAQIKPLTLLIQNIVNEAICCSLCIRLCLHAHLSTCTGNIKKICVINKLKNTVRFALRKCSFSGLRMLLYTLCEWK